MRKNDYFWLWGQFTKSCTENLFLLQKESQEILKSPSFEVHITLAGPYKNIDIFYDSSINNLLKKFQPLILDLNNYSYKNNFYKSFFISVEESNNLKSLRSEINHFYPFDLNYNYSPHISLVYGNHSKKNKDQLISKIKTHPSKIIMNKISVVEVNEKKEKWDILKSFELK